MIHFKPVLKVIGALLIMLGFMMWLCVPVSLLQKANDWAPLLISGGISIVIGFVISAFTFKTQSHVGKREGYLIVALGWIVMVSFATLPYIVSGHVLNLTDAFFESVSGMTTTGASIINDIESVSKGILFWRSLTQWIGGMGIIVLTVAIFPLLGIGGVELFVAEAPGPTSDKIHPRIRETAKVLWLLYVGITVLLILSYWAAGMSLYDAANHAFTTMATGGFSTYNSSMVDFSPLIQYIAIVFMFIAGINYTVIYFGVTGRFRKMWSSDEFKAYVFLVLGLMLMVTGVIFFTNDIHLEKAFRDASFQVISLITTTGFVSADYTAWHPSLTIIFFVLLFVGASAGSTSGGIKIIRHLAFFKNSYLEFKRLVHPRAMIPMKIDKQVVAPRTLTHILVFLLLYLIIFVFASIIMAMILPASDTNFLTAIGSVATALGNVGPGIGDVGPVDNFSGLPDPAKWFLSGLMLLGRLELFTILILFSPYFWRTN